MRVQTQRMVGNLKPFGACNVVLAFFNVFVKKFFDPSAIQAHQVVVVLPFIQLIHRFATFELTACEQTGLLKLHQHTVDGGQPNVSTFLQNQAINIFGAHVALTTFLEQLQNGDARQRGF
jgi:hypothetical protein